MTKDNIPDAASAKPLRVGLIGPGSVADQWLIPALLKVPNAVFWSVLGRDAGKAAAFASKHQAQSPHAVHTDLESFLADSAVDAVIIASPDKLHHQHALAAAAAGKHVFLEKPMATSLSEAREIRDACQKADVQLMLGYHLRFHSGHQKLAALLATGAIGEIQHMRASWTMVAPPGDWRATALGRWWSLGAVGTHCIDLARYLLGKSCGKIESLTSRQILAQTLEKSQGGSDESAFTKLRFASGATADIVNSVVFRAPRSVEIYGSKGFALCLDTLGPRGKGSITVNGAALDFAPQDPYEAELAHFVDCVKTGGVPLCGGSDGVDNVDLLEQAVANQQSSTDTGRA